MATVRTEWAYHAKILRLDFSNEVSWDNRNLFLNLHRFSIKIPKGKFLYVLKDYRNLVKINKFTGLSFEIIEEQLFALISGVKFEIQTHEELYIINEVFVGGTYNFNLPGDVTVIDVGMNVGIGSLFFASKPNVKKVYSYELFKPTYEQGQVNLSINDPFLTDKIESFNFGLADKARFEDLKYNYHNKGRVGILGTQLVYGGVDLEETVHVELKSAYKEMTKVLKERLSDSVVIKIDTEGAEYEIFESIDSLLSSENIKIVMVEWHLKGPDLIEECLIRNGFTTLSLDAFNTKAGMLYGFK